jgi:hypothetical protein
MPNWRTLKVGDRIRLLGVPAADQRQRDEEVALGSEDAGYTADIIARIVAQSPLVTIAQIDEFGQPWYRADVRLDDGTTEEHWMAVCHDDAWELADTSPQA